MDGIFVVLFQDRILFFRFTV